MPETPQPLPSAGQISVEKLNCYGEIVWRYSGRMLERHRNRVVLAATYNLNDMPLPDVVLQRGDRFVETFYNDRWYNIFEVFDRDNGTSKGWYCNVSRPATIEDDRISWVDLALDLWVSPDGKQTLLDEDEFLELNLEAAEVKRARAAVEALRRHFARRFAS
jgi:predicted RNA-binding protein associated with RNAse of E/G family